MKIAYIAAGAGGMYCGSCLHDNAVAGALQRQGHDVALIPTYTPLRTDSAGVSIERVFYGALNVYLQHKVRWFRRTPWLLDRLLDRPRLLTWITRFSASTDARELGDLTLSVLRGEQGAQAKELEKLVDWLATDFRPDLVHITNSLFLGMVRRLKEELKVPVVVSCQGEDLFIQDLPEPYRSEVTRHMRLRAADADAFVVPSRFYAAAMGELLAVAPERMTVVPLGLQLAPFAAAAAPAPERPPTLGYLARIAPEKGLHHLVDAFCTLAREPGRESLRLRIAGWLGAKDEPYFAEQMARIQGWGLGARVEHAGELDLAGKARFLAGLDVFSVPTVYREPKGLPVLEALACGVPVVQPRHGSFPEIVAATGGGLLVDPESPKALADGLRELLDDPARRRALGQAGREAVGRLYSDTAEATATLALYERLRPSAPADLTRTVH